ncbi:MAG TPA: serine/threonine protein kinase, partial [Candidatus Methylomirabilis sp.]|nr:serine/threonine protein kinase [Candidatus Methylomirabilis sp.]
EQWYHAKGAEPGTELAKALSECDGGRVQAIILVRDDYSMALHRFMAVIGVRQNQDQNFAVVDLFDLQHARKVLIAFGRGYGMLPDDPKEMTGAQNDFLDRTIEGLSQEGRVISVRLALFAEMLKGKPWTPETFNQVGGAEGVGVTFLEETFSDRMAPPSYRIHQKAAQAVLRALLPETGSNIKGNMRSYDELLVVSGYGSRPNEFDELLRILNVELKLISPIEPEGSESDGQTKMQVGEKFFLLTHDYLVPSIREWLTRKQKETRRGQAELRLVDRSSLWNAKPENRHLPSLLEWTNIGLLTKKKDWTEPQRKMMRRAGRVHGLWGLGLAVLIALVSWGGMEGYGGLRASALVESLQSCVTSDAPAIVKQLSGYRRWADPQLVRVAQGTDAQSREHLHASLALLPVDPSQVDYLFNRLLSATENELPVLRDALKTHQFTLTPKLWAVLESAKPDAGLLPAASALASYDPDNARWESAGGKVAQALVTVNSLLLRPWIEDLRPVRGKLTAPLATIFRDRNRSESDRAQATDILTDYASDDLDLITNLLMDADPTAYADFFLIAQ